MSLNRPLPLLPPIRGIFITGTDTDVGKTWVAAGLTAALRQRGVAAVYFKPVQSGCPEAEGRLVPTDADFARRLAGLTEPLNVLTPIALRLPLAPGVAAAQAGVVRYFPTGTTADPSAPIAPPGPAAAGATTSVVPSEPAGRTFRRSTGIIHSTSTATADSYDGEPLSSG